MILFYVLIGIVVVAGGVVGFLFILFNKESKKPLEQKIDPVTIISENQQATQTSFAELEYKKRVEELENELKEISDRGTMQASEAMQLIDKLTKENQELKKAHATATPPVDKTQELEQAQQQTDQLRQDNFLLGNQLQQAHAKVEQLEQEGLAIRARLEEDLKAARETVEIIKAEKEAIVLNRENSSQALQALTRELEEAKNEVVQLQNEIGSLRQTNDQLRVSHDNLFNQAQMFQQELIRQRAQITGLERICENYRIQVEEKVNP